jgi:peptidoglycan/xylan/chitin deacetylase (PgdA/CDA1 family)
MSRATVKRLMLRACEMLGCFALARRLTRTRLRILCYHGFSIGDQHEFSPLLFLKVDTFARHLKMIQRMGIPVVSLDDGLALLKSDGVRHAETVITIDDGWKTTLTLAGEHLRDSGLPASLYVTSYYVGKPAAVFNVVVRYMLWRCAGQVIDVRSVHPQIDGMIDLRNGNEDTVQRWTSFADSALSWQERQQLLRALAPALGLEIDDVLAEGRFSLLDEQELATLRHQGVDIQLHTHRHRFPAADFAQVKREIDDNRAVLESIQRGPCDHFCYPSGLFSQNHPAWLRSLGVASATTCEPGLNDAATDPYLLRRYLAREDASDVELASELSGFSEILREGRAKLRSIAGSLGYVEQS